MRSDFSLYIYRRNTASKVQIQPECGEGAGPNPSREIKFLRIKGDMETLFILLVDRYYIRMYLVYQKV